MAIRTATLSCIVASLVTLIYAIASFYPQDAEVFLFPRIIAVLMAVLCVILWVNTITSAGSDEPKRAPMFSGVLPGMGIGLVYLLVMETVGFYTSSLLAFTAIAVVYSGEKQIEVKSLLKKIIIAIDGHSSCGKSTLAHDLSKNLDYIYISSGAMYRAVTLYFLQHNVDIKDEAAVAKALEQIKIHFEIEKDNTLTFLNDVMVEEEIRSMYVSNFVSPVSTLPIVRKAMVAQQQVLGKDKGIVMDGRDIGTVVFKEAELKIFLTADPNIRAQRRYDEIKDKGEGVDIESVKANLISRDHIDSTREDSPLAKADDAVIIDNSNLSKKEQMAMVLALVQERISSQVSV